MPFSPSATPQLPLHPCDVPPHAGPFDRHTSVRSSRLLSPEDDMGFTPTVTARQQLPPAKARAGPRSGRVCHADPPQPSGPLRAAPRIGLQARVVRRARLADEQPQGASARVVGVRLGLAVRRLSGGSCLWGGGGGCWEREGSGETAGVEREGERGWRAKGKEEVMARIGSDDTVVEDAQPPHTGTQHVPPSPSPHASFLLHPSPHASPRPTYPHSPPTRTTDAHRVHSEPAGASAVTFHAQVDTQLRRLNDSFWSIVAGLEGRAKGARGRGWGVGCGCCWWGWAVGSGGGSGGGVRVGSDVRTGEGVEGRWGGGVVTIPAAAEIGSGRRPSLLETGRHTASPTLALLEVCLHPPPLLAGLHRHRPDPRAPAQSPSHYPTPLARTLARAHGPSHSTPYGGTLPQAPLTPTHPTGGRRRLGPPGPGAPDAGGISMPSYSHSHTHTHAPQAQDTAASQLRLDPAPRAARAVFPVPVAF
ncbi:hypothetical protein JB92DRAFT_3098540 [Gautieria morchelliformis]|nr:hypothetical protein JB92DRAFT_3098540 [Gautieria morchelliformis]